MYDLEPKTVVSVRFLREMKGRERKRKGKGKEQRRRRPG
jgi:hypothetical protein